MIGSGGCDVSLVGPFDKAAPGTDILIQETYLAVSQLERQLRHLYPCTPQLTLASFDFLPSNWPWSYHAFLLRPSRDLIWLQWIKSVKQGTAQESVEKKPCPKKQGIKAAKRNKILLKREKWSDAVDVFDGGAV